MINKKHRPWTNADRKLFEKLWAEGISTQDCSLELNRTYKAIEKARSRYGLPLREKHGRSKGVKQGRPYAQHSKNSPAAREHSSAMKRETDAQSRLWARLLARAAA
jgi:hypothetical protein